MQNLETNLASELEHLLAMPLLSDLDLSAWLDHVEKFKNDLNDKFSTLPKGIYWEIVYYLHDPDIRMRDQDYADMQECKIKNLISDLRSGAFSLSNTAERDAAANP